MAKDDAFKRIQKKVQNNFELKEEHQAVQHPERFRFIGSFQQGLAPALKQFSANEKSDGGLYGFIDSIGTEVISFQYHNAKAFSEGLAAVAIFEKKKQKKKEETDDLFGTIADLFLKKTELPLVTDSGIQYGFIDLSGALAIPFQFQDAKTFENGRTEVKQNGQWFWINKKGERV